MPSEGVWIDQICINQENEAEKQVFINAMDFTYKCARAVVIILDDIEITTTEWEALRCYILEYEKETQEGSLYPYYDNDPPYLTTNIVIRNFCLKIFRAMCFSRAWCLHESRLGKQHIFLIRCDEQPVTLPTVFRFTNLFMPHLISLSVKGKLEKTPVWLVSVLTGAKDDNLRKDIRAWVLVQAQHQTG